MKHRTLDEMITYFNQQLSEMDIDRKYKIQLFGMMTAIGFEAQERKGHWQITDAYPHNVYCSECHKRFAQTHWAVWEDGSLPRKFCPNCGARMEVEQLLSEADNDTAYGGLMSAT